MMIYSDSLFFKYENLRRQELIQVAASVVYLVTGQSETPGVRDGCIRPDCHLRVLWWNEVGGWGRREQS